MFRMYHNSTSEGQTQAKGNRQWCPGCRAWPLRPPAGCVYYRSSTRTTWETHPLGVAEKEGGPVIIYIHIYDTSTPPPFRGATFQSESELTTQRVTFRLPDGARRSRFCAGNFQNCCGIYVVFGLLVILILYIELRLLIYLMLYS